MNTWSLACLLLECVSGKPLFTLPPLETSIQERADVIKVENVKTLEQVECSWQMKSRWMPYMPRIRLLQAITRNLHTQTISKVLALPESEAVDDIAASLEAVALGNSNSTIYLQCIGRRPRHEGHSKASTLLSLPASLFPFRSAYMIECSSS